MIRILLFVLLVVALLVLCSISFVAGGVTDYYLLRPKPMVATPPPVYGPAYHTARTNHPEVEDPIRLANILGRIGLLADYGIPSDATVTRIELHTFDKEDKARLQVWLNDSQKDQADTEVVIPVTHVHHHSVTPPLLAKK